MACLPQMRIGVAGECDCDTLNALTKAILGAAIQIHRTLGPGLLERAYLACLTYELAALGLRLEKQKAIPLVYGTMRIGCAYRADILVEGLVVVEVKARDQIAPVHRRQLHTYIRLADCRVGLLLNFGAAVMRDGIYRAVNRFPDGEHSSKNGD